MASTATYIADMAAAIDAGVVPGAFSADRTVFEFRTLSYSGARGVTHHWTIRVRLLREGSADYARITPDMLKMPAPPLPGYRAEITVESQQAGGKVRDTVPTYVSAGKNLGKRNATNPVTQALRDALGKYNKQKKLAGYDEGSRVSTAAPRGDGSLTPPGESLDGSAPGGPPARSIASLGDESLVPPGETPDDSAPGGPQGARLQGENPPGEEGLALRPPPMLVQNLGDSREATLTPEVFAEGVTAQRKLNGVHFVVYAAAKPDGSRELVRYSRTGTAYPGQEHLVAELLPMFATAPPLLPGQGGLPPAPATEEDRRILAAYGALPGGGDPAPYFAGELYLHGKSLNWISGQARRGDDEGLLEFHVFDVFFPRAKAAGHDMASRHRQAYIDEFFRRADAAGQAHSHVKRVENFPVRDLAELNALARRFTQDGYEGAIARKDGAGYRYSYNNYHAPHVVKIKPVLDAEFPVVGFTQGTRGKDVGAVIWECEVPAPANPRDKNFSVVPKDLSYEDRYALYRCLGRLVPGPDGALVTRFERDVKGLPLTVEYRELSAKTGKPLQAKALAFRTYEGGPDKDPIRKLLADCRDE